MNPFTGTWVAELSKSRRHPNHQFQGATLRFEVSGEVVSLTHSGVNMAGKHEFGTHVLASEAKKDGEVVGRGTYEVSDSGSCLTATVSGTDASGAPFEQVIVFDRQ